MLRVTHEEMTGGLGERIRLALYWVVFAYSGRRNTPPMRKLPWCLMFSNVVQDVTHHSSTLKNKRLEAKSTELHHSPSARHPRTNYNGIILLLPMVIHRLVNERYVRLVDWRSPPTEHPRGPGHTHRHKLQTDTSKLSAHPM